jgi:Arc/MetJ-type ribon-helix-helix transcriptional regulator
MNFSVHLPQPLLVNLDNFAKTHMLSRSGVVREAVEAFLSQKTKSEWSPEMMAWMQEGLQPGFKADIEDWPDFDAIRREMNDGQDERTEQLLRDLSDEA